MSAFVNLKAAHANQEQKVNVTCNTNLKLTSEIDKETKQPQVNVTYDTDSNPYSQLSTMDWEKKVKSLESLCEVQKCVIQMMSENPLRIKDFIVADDAVLARFIQILCDCANVEIDAEDIGEGCFTKNVYRKVKAIYAIDGTGEVVENVKYTHPDVMKTLKDLRISTKFVF